VFLGIAPGAGKTYAMLAEGRRLADSGADVAPGLLGMREQPGLLPRGVLG